ncbi:MAG: TIGR03905 family TSCPD domain-containing protein [Mycoplasmataceae bacterium]|jgi:uncharacterized protein (TIGR03905 family)|nr:TIGR03905 family TSCPD domain-containing protein [Mycoplasmataceae bacterium]
MKYTYKPSNVCATEIIFDIKNNKLMDLKVINGCQGSSKGIARLIKNKKIDDVATALRHIECENRHTSCPDQIAIALEKIIKNRK